MREASDQKETDQRDRQKQQRECGRGEKHLAVALALVNI
jgi:hypothetical protein